MAKLKLSSWQVILLVSAFAVFVNNRVLFLALQQELDLFSSAGAGYVATLFSLVIGVLALILLVLGQKFILKFLLVLVLIMSASISYFNQAYGVIFDVDMIRNIVETVKDNNQKEAMELISTPLLIHVGLFGILPSIILIFFVKIRYKKFFPEVFSRLGSMVGIIALIAIMVLVNYKYVTFFSRENRDLRVWVTPVFSLVSGYKYIKKQYQGADLPFRVLGEDAVQQKANKRRTVGIMVLGETARADHFSLNGYDLETNPLLKKEQVVSLQNVSSCGTSTAFSVPCMFSFLNRDGYTPIKASKQSNVLDVLSTAGVKTVWIDNNSSCKGVCERIETNNILQDPDASSDFYAYNGYYDERLLQEIPPLIEANSNDLLIVLHTMGSHGPAYHRRYPEKFAQFRPFCKTNSPQECTDEEVRNAYDNTILYTDFILSEIINLLKQQSEEVDSFMVYVSDHGESLGENGVYLHGLPYFIAPKGQTHVPFISWFSEGFKKDHPVHMDSLQKHKNNAYSHDNLSQSLLGLFSVKSAVYQADKDILSGEAKVKQ